MACLSGVSGWAEPCTGPCISQREESPGTEVLFAPCNLMVGCVKMDTFEGPVLLEAFLSQPERFHTHLQREPAPLY